MKRGVTLPLTHVELGILCAMVVLGGLVLWWLSGIRHGDRAQGRQRGNSERLIEVFAWLLTPVWTALILFVLYIMWRVGNRLIELGPGEDLRWYALGFVGLVTALAALFSAPLALIRVATTERQTRTAEQGHMTDRISKAVEQLGAEKTVKKIVTGEDGKPTTQETSEPNLEVRIGGLLSLERIAQDSTAYDNGRDHVRVMEIICAYVRNNAPASMAKDFPLGPLEDLPDDATAEQRATRRGYLELRGHKGSNLTDFFRSLDGPREDIMLALCIIERRSDRQRLIEAAHGQEGVHEADWVFAQPCPDLPDPPTDEPYGKGQIEGFMKQLQEWSRTMAGYGGYRPDLRSTCLQRSDLSGFRLAGVRLDGARIEGANLIRARLEGAILNDVRLDGSDLGGTQLGGGRISQASLEGAVLMSANLAGASLGETRLEGADMRWAQLANASLISAKLERADLWQTGLASAEFMWARLEGADLEEAHMAWLSFWEARFDANTNLRGADLSEVIFRGVDLSSVAISVDQVKASFGDASVVLPNGIDRPGHWPDWELVFEEFHEEWRRWQSDPDSYTPPKKPTP